MKTLPLGSAVCCHDQPLTQSLQLHHLISTGAAERSAVQPIAALALENLPKRLDPRATTARLRDYPENLDLARALFALELFAKYPEVLKHMTMDILNVLMMLAHRRNLNPKLTTWYSREDTLLCDCVDNFVQLGLVRDMSGDSLYKLRVVLTLAKVHHQQCFSMLVEQLFERVDPHKDVFVFLRRAVDLLAIAATTRVDYPTKLLQSIQKYIQPVTKAQLASPDAQRMYQLWINSCYLLDLASCPQAMESWKGLAVQYTSGKLKHYPQLVEVCTTE